MQSYGGGYYKINALLGDLRLKILFTTNEKPLSKALRYLFNEPVSHVGILFQSLDLVVDSSTTGVKITRKKTFVKKNTPILEIQLDDYRFDELVIFNELLDKIECKGYDFGAYFWFALEGLKHKLFRKNLSLGNPSQNDEQVLCTEIFYPIFPYLLTKNINLYKYDLAALTPFMLYRIMKDQLDEADSKKTN